MRRVLAAISLRSLSGITLFSGRELVLAKLAGMRCGTSAFYEDI
ncbi:hypothetical protein [Pseudomonas monteilii]|nr:hypothetical protein [Pseudomonas monteilii]